MKCLLYILLAIPFLLCADKVQDAEELFARGEFDQCEKNIDELLKSDTKLNPAQQRRLVAMREYILGSNPEKIAAAVKEAQVIAAHKGWLTSDLLKHSSLLIRRAEDWKARGIPEYQDLSDAASTLLAQGKDGGIAEIAIKLVILKTKNFNLNGEYHEPLYQIKQLLRLYYPARDIRRGKRPPGAIQLLILMGEQYAGLGIADNSRDRKKEAFAAAAEYYLKAFNDLSPRSPYYQDLCDRLILCQETLRLLGYRLRLPAKIKPQSKVSVEMIDTMLRERRYHDVVLALEKNNASAMKLRRAVALSAIGKSTEAIEIAKSIDNNQIPDPHLLLNAARFAMAAKKHQDAAVLLQLFLRVVPSGADALNARQNYANILLEQRNYAEAATAFEQLSEQIKNNPKHDHFLFRAAQCMYQAGEYRKCVEKLSGTSSSPECLMLTAQAKIKLSDFSGALKVLQQLLSGAKLSNEIQLQALKLAIACAIETDRPAAIKLLNAFLAGYPQEEETPDYAVRLFKLYEHNSATETAYNKLGTWGLENRLQAADTVPLVLKCAGHITDKATKEKLLRGLLKRQDFTAGELAVLLEHLPGVQLKLEFIERYKKPFANTPELCVLYLRIAEIEMEQKNYLSALRHCEKLLSQKEVFRYKVCKLLQARAYMELKNETQGRQVYQELLLTSLKQEEKCQIIQELANSWERSGKAEKAIATAWTAIPLDGKITDETKPIVKTLLHLIIRNAEKINSQEDLKDARELLTAL